MLNKLVVSFGMPQVSEAIQIGARAIKENNITMKEVEHCLQQLEDSIDLQKQVESALGNLHFSIGFYFLIQIVLPYLSFSFAVTDSASSYTFVEDEDIEEEFKDLELEIGGGDHHRPVPNVEAQSESRETKALEFTDSPSDAFANLKVVDAPSSTTAGQDIAAKKTKILELEAA